MSVNPKTSINEIEKAKEELLAIQANARRAHFATDASALTACHAESFIRVSNGVVQHIPRGFTRSLALSLAPKVRVNCIAPGWIQTAWGRQASDVWQERVRRETPLGRWGTPEDVAGAVVWLCSDAAAYVTGHNLTVDGGLIAQGSTSRRS